MDVAYSVLVLVSINCNVVAPVPGPQWQPQSAKTVQRRLNNGQYVPRVCPQN